MQEDSSKTGKVTSAGMFFLGFPVYRFEQNNSVSIQVSAFFFFVDLSFYFFVGSLSQAPITSRLLL